MVTFTENFIPKFEVENNKKDIDALKEELKKKGHNCYFDMRNSIYCINPTFDTRMLKNYIDYLNSHRNEWTNYGRFDMGMVPFEMWPNFDKENGQYTYVRHEWKKLADSSGLHLVRTKSVTLLRQSYVTAYGYDCWVFREDMFKYLQNINNNPNSVIHIDNLQSPDQPLFSMYVEAWCKAEENTRRAEEEKRRAEQEKKNEST